MVLLYSKKLPIGWKAKDFKLKNTEGKYHTLKDFLHKRGVLIVFTCNHCPYAQASWPLIISLYQKYEQDIVFIAINSNDDKLYPEDSFGKMKMKKIEWRIPFSYLQDKTQKTAKAYRAQCTPDLYLFKNEKGELKLFYHGRINDNWQDPKEAKEENLKQAIERLLNNKLPPKNQPASMGCSIKWKVKKSK